MLIFLSATGTGMHRKCILVTYAKEDSFCSLLSFYLIRIKLPVTVLWFVKSFVCFCLLLYFLHLIICWHQCGEFKSFSRFLIIFPHCILCYVTSGSRSSSKLIEFATLSMICMPVIADSFVFRSVSNVLWSIVHS